MRGILLAVCSLLAVLCFLGLMFAILQGQLNWIVINFIGMAAWSWIGYLTLVEDDS